MISLSDWARSYAQQAQADLTAYVHLVSIETVPACVRLHCLQMACEKLVKASLLRYGSRLADVDSIHAVVRSTLPRIYVDYFRRRFGKTLSNKSTKVHRINLYAKEIDALHPSVNREQRPDNCEYPWVADDRLIVPATFRFALETMLTQDGAQFLKFVSTVINEFAA